MKIANPWPFHPHVRFNINNGEAIGVCGPGQSIEVPGDPEEILIEPIAGGRSDARAITKGRIWSKCWGLLDIEDHLKKQEIAAEEIAMQGRAGKERTRKAKEARIEHEETCGPRVLLDEPAAPEPPSQGMQPTKKSD